MTQINFNVDTDLRNQFSKVCTELGMDMSTVLRVFTAAVVRAQGIPFDVSLKTPNEETLEAMQEVEEMKKNPHLYPGYTNPSEMLQELLS